MKHIIIYRILIMVVMLPLSLLTSADERTELGSDEIKNLRYLSRALIKSRAIEKDKIDKELVTQRIKLNEMQNAIDDQLLKVMNSSQFKPNQASSVGELLINGKVVSSGVMHQSLSSKQYPTSIAATNNQKVVRDAIQRLSNARNEVARTVPKQWEFWKSKKAIDKRSEKIIIKNKEVVSELEMLVKNENIDMKKLRSLKNKLTLKKLDVQHENVHPTLQTRTKHRQ